MSWLLWKLFGLRYAVIFDKMGFPNVSRIRYSNSCPMGREFKRAYYVELYSDGKTSGEGKWKPLYPSNYKHPDIS